MRIAEEVLIYRNKQSKRWLDPFSVLDVKDKAVLVQINERVVRYSVDKCKRFRQTVSSDDHDEEPTIAADVHQEKVGKRTRYDPMIDEELDTFGRLVDYCWNRSNDRTEYFVNIFTLKLIKPANKRAQKSNFTTAKQEEVNGIIERHIVPKKARNALQNMQTY